MKTGLLSGSMGWGLCLLAGSACLLVVAYRWWMGRFRKRTPAFSPARRVSLAALEALERRIGGRLPAALREAYLEGSVERVVLPKTFRGREVEEVVNSLLAADAEANHSLVAWHGLPEDAFVFGTDDFGNYFLARANEEGVYFWDHEGGAEVFELWPSAREFWEVVSGGEGNGGGRAGSTEIPGGGSGGAGAARRDGGNRRRTGR